MIVHRYTRRCGPAIRYARQGVWATIVVMAFCTMILMWFSETFQPREYTPMPDLILSDDAQQEVSKPQTSTNPSKEPSKTSSTQAVQEEETEPEPIRYEGTFELPINGATGYASIETIVYDSIDKGSQIATLKPGTSFRILERNQDWLQIVLKDEDQICYISSKHVMINLPDVITSIVYEDSNSVASLFRSSGYSIDGITGEKLYEVRQYNARLGKEEFNMPILLSAAEVIQKAQTAALADGYSLKIYETYRPTDVQQNVNNAVSLLMQSNTEVYNSINTNNWSQGWFIAKGVSNHQKGYAMDCSLVKINSVEEVGIGTYLCTFVTDYTECEMPTAMHELSAKAAALVKGVSSSSSTAWENVAPAETMTEDALRLQKYCTNAGLTPLASEWWHFNALNAMKEIGNTYSTGNYYLEENCSVVPN